jgi:membrane peptidoglycan carboxypeptidase
VTRRVVSLRLLRRVKLAAMLAAGLSVLTVSFLAVGSLTLPSGQDAPARVQRLLAAHGTRPTIATPRSRALRAVVAVEDRRYFDHGAVDVRAVIRNGVHTLSGRQSDAGGSTIAQQLAKALYGRGALASIGIAFNLERRYSKPELLRMYVDVIYFGNGFWGIEQASAGYFAVSAAALGWARASLLAGLPQAPSAYNPARHPGKARARQQEVLQALVNDGALTPAAAGAAYRQAVSVRR